MNRTATPTDLLTPLDADTCEELGFDPTLRTGPAAHGLPGEDDAQIFSYRLPTGQHIVGIVVDRLPADDEIDSFDTLVCAAARDIARRVREVEAAGEMDTSLRALVEATVLGDAPAVTGTGVTAAIAHVDAVIDSYRGAYLDDAAADQALDAIVGTITGQVENVLAADTDRTHA